MEENNSNNKKSGLKLKVISGLAWTFGERILAQGVSFILSIVLARILMPDEYGIIAMVLVFINIADVFVSNGFGESLIQKQDADEVDFSTVFYCSFGVSWIIYIILFFAAPVIANFYNNSILVPVLRVLALKLPISSISTIQHAYVSKHMIFKKFFFSTLGGTLFSGLVGIAFALGGLGVWALVAQYLVNTLIDTIILFITVPWRPRLLFSTKSAKELVGYGWKLTAAGLINRLYIELRSLVIGKKYSSADLAFYNKGEQFPNIIITNIDSAIGKVVFPAMNAVNDNMEKLRDVSRRTLKTTSYIIFPLLTGLIIVAKPLVQFLLTDKWLGCVPLLQVACLFYICQPMQTVNFQIIKAVGRSDLCLKLEIVKKILGVAMLLVSMNYGVMAIAASNAAFAVISMLINMIPNKKLIGYSMFQQFKDLIPATCMSLVMGLFVWLVGLLNIAPIFILIIQVIVGVSVYALGSWIFKIESFEYLLSTAKQYLTKFIGSKE